MEARRHEPLLKLGTGGMATVWVGVLPGSESLVALKRPHQHLVDDPGFKQALLREAEVASHLCHPNVVGVRALETFDGAPHLVMDYVEGPSLGQILVLQSKGGRKLAAGSAIRIALDACAGLEALHSLQGSDGKAKGFVHRDVSPQNILVGADGMAKICDFGLAKCAEGSEQPTTQGTLKGKLGYMAPEYVRGLPIDRRADVFAMGVVIWEALSGRRLFRGENDADTIERVQNAPVPQLSELAPELGEGFDAVLARALARSADERFAGMAELASALEAQAIAAGLDTGRASVAAHVEATCGEELAARRREVARLLSTKGTPGFEERTIDQRPKPQKKRAPKIALAGILAAGLAAGALVLWDRGPDAPSAPPSPPVLAAGARPEPAAEPPKEKAAEPASAEPKPGTSKARLHARRKKHTAAEPRGASQEAGSGPGRLYGGAQDVRREPRGASPEAGSPPAKKHAPLPPNPYADSEGR